MCEYKGFFSDVIASCLAEKYSLVVLNNTHTHKKGMWDGYVILQVFHLENISLHFFPVTHLPIVSSSS